MSLSLEEARRHAPTLGVLNLRKGNRTMPESIEQLKEQASKLKIFGWQDMDAAELRAAIETAEQEAPLADVPTEQAAQATKAERGES